MTCPSFHNRNFIPSVFPIYQVILFFQHLKSKRQESPFEKPTQLSIHGNLYCIQAHTFPYFPYDILASRVCVYDSSRGRFPVKSLSKLWFVTGGSRHHGRRGKQGMRREESTTERGNPYSVLTQSLLESVCRARACVRECVCVHTLVCLWPRSRLLPCGLGEKWRVNARTRRVRHSQLKREGVDDLREKKDASRIGRKGRGGGGARVIEMKEHK